MDGGGGGKEFADWELLQNSDENHPVNSPHLSLLDGIEGDSEGLIRFDYFSLDSQLKYKNYSGLSEEGSVESDNPSWIDPVAIENRYKRKNYSYSGEFFSSDSGSEKSISFVENDRLQLGVDGIGEADRIRVQEHGEQQVNFEEKSEISIYREALGTEGSKQDIGLPENGQFLMGCKEIGDPSISVPRIGAPEMEGESGLLEKGGSQGGLEANREAYGLESESVRVVEARNGWEALNKVHRGDGEEVDIEKENEVAEDKGKEVKLENVEDEVKKGLVWWKLPVELLKFCVFKVSPVWSISIAAAVVGFVILKRRLYKMKQKKMSLQMKVTMDDKVNYALPLKSFSFYSTIDDKIKPLRLRDDRWFRISALDVSCIVCTDPCDFIMEKQNRGHLNHVCIRCTMHYMILFYFLFIIGHILYNRLVVVRIFECNNVLGTT